VSHCTCDNTKGPDFCTGCLLRAVDDGETETQFTLDSENNECVWHKYDEETGFNYDTTGLTVSYFSDVTRAEGCVADCYNEQSHSY
jgi:hypothetical protein